MSNGKHFWIWFVLFMAAFWVTPLLITDQQSKERIGAELATVAHQFGEETHNRVVDNANALYKALILDTGVQAIIAERVVNQIEQKQSERFYGKTLTRLSDRTNNYLANAATNFYGLAIRTQLLLMWLPLLIPFLLGAVADGYASRMIKMSAFGYFSPAVFSAAAHTLIFLVCLPLLYLIVPFVMSPFWIPVMAVLAAIALRQVIINAQRLFG